MPGGVVVGESILAIVSVIPAVCEAQFLLYNAA